MIDIAGAVAVQSIDEASRDQPEPAHAAAGVRGVAAHYGDPMREQRLLDTEVGLVDRSHRGSSRYRARSGSPGCTPSPPSTWPS